MSGQKKEKKQRNTNNKKHGMSENKGRNKLRRKDETYLCEWILIGLCIRLAIIMATNRSGALLVELKGSEIPIWSHAGTDLSAAPALQV